MRNEIKREVIFGSIARGVAECQAADRAALFALLDLCMMMRLYLNKQYEDACKVCVIGLY